MLRNRHRNAVTGDTPADEATGEEVLAEPADAPEPEPEWQPKPLGSSTGFGPGSADVAKTENP